jgi:HTH-type transcriptional regulator/antitoxin HigA
MASNAKVISSYQRFAETAQPLLNITDVADYEAALALVEQLLDAADDTAHEPLNGLIGLLSNAIKSYENSDKSLVKFETEATTSSADVTLLRLLMDQHKLSLKDFPEIGDKTLLSRILRGERNLTKEHIKKLAARFSISPALFF